MVNSVSFILNMSPNHQCPGLINSSNEYGDKVPLRVVVLNGCYYTSVDIFNIIIKALKRPIIMTYCNSYEGSGTTIIGRTVLIYGTLSKVVNHPN